MSLDVYLEGNSRTEQCMCPNCFNEHERTVTEELYWSNITHNLGRMAAEAGIYKYLWQPDEIGITKAEQLIEPLQRGLDKLRSDPDRFKAFNPENGWGSYDGLVEFVESYLIACIENPSATIRISR